MKRIRYKKIVEIVLWVFGLSSIFFLLSFVNKKENDIKGRSINIKISDESELSFVSEEDVIEFLQKRKDTLINHSVHKSNFYEIEKSLNAHPAISKANIAVDINGDVRIKLEQRNPIVRIFNLQGESFYIDAEKKLMPLSDNYAARVPVASGHIAEWYSLFYPISIDELETDSSLTSISCLDDIYRVAEYLQKDSAMGALIHQLYITKEGEIELYPAVGNHKILFGKGEDVEEKFKKLKIFYTEGLNSLNSWNNYSAINLKFRNQVICIKK